MNTLKNLYKEYIRSYTSKKYEELQDYNCNIIGENILGNYYFLLFENNNSENQTYYLIVENCKNPKIIHLKRSSTNPHYYTFNKNILKANMPAYKKLVKNGLFKSLKSGFSELNNLASIHRLNMCLYKNILNLEVHHNDKNKKNNHITNLTPIDEYKHDELDLMAEPEFSILTSKYNNEFIQELSKTEKNRNTLASRDNIVLNVISLLNKNIKPKEISRILKHKIKKSKIYEIKNYFYYAPSFINYLKTHITNGIDNLNGNLQKQWNRIYKFEEKYKLKITSKSDIFTNLIPLLNNCVEFQIKANASGYY